jgi:hypothetical protein
MIYLSNVTRQQPLSIPRNDRSVEGGVYALAIVDAVDNIERTVAIESIAAGRNYYTMEVSLPEGTHRGEYVYLLTCDGVLVAQGLAFIGNADMVVPTMGEYIPEVVAFAEAIEYVMHDVNVDVVEYADSVDVVQASADVEYVEYDEREKIEVRPDYIFLTPGNNFTEDVLVLANVEWKIG